MTLAPHCVLCSAGEQSPYCGKIAALLSVARNDTLYWLYLPLIGNFPIGQFKNLLVSRLHAKALLARPAPARQNFSDFQSLPRPH